MSMEQVLQQLQDAATVTAAIHERHARMIVDHEEWLVEQTKAIARHEKWLATHEAAMERIETNHANWRAEHEAAIHRIEGLLEAFLRGRGSNGGGGS
jgi:hypothetical protein